MLAYIKGTLEEVEEDCIVVDHQGMGYRIYTSGMDIGMLPSPGQTVKLHLYMHLREDAITLFGFLSKDALHLFELLISVSGIGPKAGLAILSALSVNDIYLAILSGDVKTLTKANGVGSKGAQRVIIELKDKLKLDSLLENSDTMQNHTKTSASDISGNPGNDITSGNPIAATAMALTSLGYTQSEAMQAIKQVEQADTMTEETLLKAALKKMI